jgi:hypothetical protein
LVRLPQNANDFLRRMSLLFHVRFLANLTLNPDQFQGLRSEAWE